MFRKERHQVTLFWFVQSVSFPSLSRADRRLARCYLSAPFSPPASPSHLWPSPLFPFWLRWITHYYGLLRPSWIIADNDAALISSDCLWLNYQQVLTPLCADKLGQSQNYWRPQAADLNPEWDVKATPVFIKILFDDEWFFFGGRTKVYLLNVWGQIKCSVWLMGNPVVSWFTGW